MATSFASIYGQLNHPTSSQDMSYIDKEKIKEKGLEHIVSAIIELEDDKPSSYTIHIKDDRVVIHKIIFSSSFRIIVTSDYMELQWMSSNIKMKRAKSEEEYFQMMCLDDTYCDVEFEKGIKQLIDLHITKMLKTSAVGGFIEGVYDNTSNGE